MDVDERCPECGQRILYNGNYFCPDCDWALDPDLNLDKQYAVLLKEGRIAREHFTGR